MDKKRRSNQPAEELYPGSPKRVAAVVQQPLKETSVVKFEHSKTDDAYWKGKGHYNELEQWGDKLTPARDSSNNLVGEMIRSFNSLMYDLGNNDACNFGEVRRRNLDFMAHFFPSILKYVPNKDNQVTSKVVPLCALIRQLHYDRECTSCQEWYDGEMAYCPFHDPRDPKSLYQWDEYWWREKEVNDAVRDVADWVKTIFPCPDDEEEDEVLLWASYTLLGDVLGYCLRHALPKVFSIEGKFDALEPLRRQPKL